MSISKRWHISIEGTVQGVGFRPFIWRLATEMGLFGHVFNHSEGVTVEVEGDEMRLDAFVRRIETDLPPLAHIQNIQIKEVSPNKHFQRVVIPAKAGIQSINECWIPASAGMTSTTTSLHKGRENEFKIIESADLGAGSTSISPDIAPCEDCMNEMMNAGDRRNGYPFINCTNCGPRYSIIQKLPYDRPMTTMKVFELCENCMGEYKNPADRRFHAQPNACEKCGPKIIFCHCEELKATKQSQQTANRGRLLRFARNDNDAKSIQNAVTALQSGQIVAIKGLGGYHLACDATNDDAVKRLRERKMRDEKPLAIMVADVDAARSLCDIDEAEEKLLTSPQRPIVLLRRKRLDSRLRGNDKHRSGRNDEQDSGKHDKLISDLVAPGNKYLGVMLPSTPLHHLLFDNYESRVTSHESRILVMTSGNISDEPIAFRDEEAFGKLENIADAFLTHDRDIHIRIDDSITRVMDGQPLMLRRARGYAPAPVHLNFEMPRVFATGADLKNAICLTKGNNAFLSQHLGDMENMEANSSLEMVSKHLMDILDIEPEVIATDMHPDYFTTRFGLRVTSHESRVTAVQHHHAHITSCMAENDLPNEKVIGIALDGTGYGPDGTVWGGEVLVADYEDFNRAAHFAQIAMPGGDKAAKEPWRMAVAYAKSLVDSRQSLEKNLGVKSEKIRVIEEMIEKDINCPTTSSCGRLFDAVSALIGLKSVNSFEGQAAMMLEQIADESETGNYPYDIIGSPINESRVTRPPRLAKHGGQASHESLKLDFAKTIGAIRNDMENAIDAGIISMRFHNTIIESLVDTCKSISESRVTSHESRVCLSGGCFQNAILSVNLKKRLVGEGFTVYTHSLVPPGDGGIALGQAAIAAHKFKRG